MCLLDREHAETAARAAAQQDLDARRKEFLLEPPQWAGRAVASILADQRDLPVAYLFLSILALVVPAAVAVYLLPPSHALGAAYFAATYSLFITRFLVALLHVSEHRRLFKPGMCAKTPGPCMAWRMRCTQGIFKSCPGRARVLCRIRMAACCHGALAGSAVWRSKRPVHTASCSHAPH